MIVYYIMNYAQFIINFKSNFISKQFKTAAPASIPASIPASAPASTKRASHGHTENFLLSNVSTGLSKLSMLYTEEGGSLASSD